MNRTAALMLGLIATPAMAGHHDELVINSASELRDWCKEESEARLVGQGLAPFNWTASYSDQVNTLFVKGQWRINGANLIVQCSVARGAQARFASISIQEPQSDQESQ